MCIYALITQKNAPKNTLKNYFVKMFQTLFHFQKTKYVY